MVTGADLGSGVVQRSRGGRKRAELSSVTWNKRRDISVTWSKRRDIGDGDTYRVDEGVLESMEDLVVIAIAEASILILMPASLDTCITSILVVSPRQAERTEVPGLEEVGLVLD